ncbi:MAG: hypothetical protein V2A63_03930 [Patescibacteria group bacterium]
MSPPERISILIAHCGLPQRLTRRVRLALEEVFEGLKFQVKFFCPAQHRRWNETKDYWPVRLTIEAVLKIIERHKIIFLLASQPVLDKLDDRDLPTFLSRHALSDSASSSHEAFVSFARELLALVGVSGDIQLRNRIIETLESVFQVY